jgi:hypothetical protein
LEERGADVDAVGLDGMLDFPVPFRKIATHTATPLDGHIASQRDG